MNTRISLFKQDKTPQETQTVDTTATLSIEQLIEVICKYPWAPATFRDDYRKKSNLEQVGLMVADIDDGMTIEEAGTILKDRSLKGVIATTRNHMKEKGTGSSIKPACPRFRVIVPLERPITTNEEYDKAWQAFKMLFPTMDASCKDSSRFYFPCTQVVALIEGNTFSIPKNEHQTKGNLSNLTKNFYHAGTIIESWHHTFFKACIDLLEQGHTKEEAVDYLRVCATYHDGDLDPEDYKQIDNIYNREPKYGPRSSGDKSEHSNQSTSFYKSQTIDERTARYLQDKEIKELAFQKKVPFICSAFEGIFDLANGLNLIAGETGTGKSTVAANAIAHFLIKMPNHHAIVISNEESSVDIATRIAAVLLNLNWMDYRANSLSTADQEKIDVTAKKLLKFIEIVDPDKWDMTCLEDVIAVLNFVKDNMATVSLIIIDYLQTVTHSKKDPKMEAWKVSKKLGEYLKEFSRGTPIPVVVFCQLKPKEDGPFASRIQNDKTILNHAVAAIEIVPDLKNVSTTFKIHKDRFNGNQGKEIIVRFSGGTYEPFED